MEWQLCCDISRSMVVREKERERERERKIEKERERDRDRHIDQDNDWWSGNCAVTFQGAWW